MNMLTRLLVAMFLASFSQCGRGGEKQEAEKAENRQTHAEGSPLRADAGVVQSGERCPLRILPGRSIGGVSIGSKLGDFKTVEDTYSPILKEVNGTYRVQHNGEGIVELVSIKLNRLPPFCLEVHGKTLPRTADLDVQKRFFKGCSEIEYRLGANVVVCENGTVSLSLSRKTLSIVVKLPEE